MNMVLRQMDCTCSQLQALLRASEILLHYFGKSAQYRAIPQFSYDLRFKSNKHEDIVFSANRQILINKLLIKETGKNVNATEL